jgi:Iap family predicted aminopeptidase
MYFLIFTFYIILPQKIIGEDALKRRIVVIAVSVVLAASQLCSQVPSVWHQLIGSAYTESQSYRILRRICDEAGGRLVGTSQNVKAMEILKRELQTLGYSPEIQTFTIPGWMRGNDEVTVLVPAARTLRAVALGYVDSLSTFEAPMVFAGYGLKDDYREIDARNAIVLVTQETPSDRRPLLRYEIIDTAAANGARAVLFINSRPGGRVLAGVSNFQGNPSPIPAYSITYEEGKWLQRSIEQRLDVRARITTRSYCTPIETGNIIATLPGASKKTIVVGAHFDSWDISSGAVDNGSGSAVLFELARLLKTYSPENKYTIQFVWFNGEELGIWGAKHFVSIHSDDIAAMINMDMIGTPTGFNVMGFDEYVPFLQELVRKLPGFNLTQGVTNVPYTNSDYQPFYLRGIPAFTLHGHLDDESTSYYHDLGDSFDKINAKYIADAAAVVAILTRELANSTTLSFKRKSEKETIETLKKHGVDQILKRQKEWPFKSQ